MVAVAQLVESRIVIPVVAGSIPVGHPSKFKHLAQLSRLGFLFFGFVSALCRFWRSISFANSKSDNACTDCNCHTHWH